MRVLWFLLLTLVVTGSVIVALDDDTSVGLRINNIIENLELCTSKQAMAFYSSLDGYQQQLDNIEYVKNSDTLEFWYNLYSQWIDEKWASFFATDGCYGAQYVIFGLMSKASYSLLEQMIGYVSDNPAQDMLLAIRDMAENDLATIAQGGVSDKTLQINKLIMELPVCSNEQAIAFYGTIGGFAQEVDKLVLVNDWQSLEVWLSIFHAWRQDAWTPFYEHPCGGSLAAIHYLEAITPLVILLQVAWIDAPITSLAQVIQDWHGAAAVDLKIIEQVSKE